MRGLIPSFLTLAIVAEGGLSRSRAHPSASCEAIVSPVQHISRGLPQSLYDQGRRSLPQLYPQHRLLAERRDGRIGKVEYSLLVFQVTPVDSVVLEAVAVDWETRARAWKLDAQCPQADWTAGLIAMMQALAALPARPTAGIGGSSPNELSLAGTR